MCAQFEVPRNMRPFSGKALSLYKDCYAVDTDRLKEPWIPKVICEACFSRLRRWKTSLYFSSPASWRQPVIHDLDCYACNNKTFGYNSSNKYLFKPKVTAAVTMPVLARQSRQIETINVENREPEIDLVHEPMEGDDDIREISAMSDEDEALSEPCADAAHEEYKDRSTSKIPLKFSQEELNDLVRDLRLSKYASEVLASRLNEKGLLEKGVKICFYRDRDVSFRKHFTKDESLVYCNDVDALFHELKITHKPEEWRLFIDSSKRSLKAVLLHNTNKIASIPIAHSTVMDESYLNMEYLLEKIAYPKHQWLICTDLKVVTIILGQQSGYTKFPCFLCLWDSRDRENHYKVKEWPARSNFDIGENNILQEKLVDPAKILLPPLHIKLGLIKQFIKALKKRDSDAFDYLFRRFPKLSEAKIKEGVFNGPQIRELIRDPKFPRKMALEEKMAWQSFVDVSTKFLGNYKDPEHEKMVSQLLVNYEAIGCLMSLKVHLVDSHRDHFPDNIGHYSEEQGERFHQDIKAMEKRYQGFEDENMMADYCWNLPRDSPMEHNRKALTRSLLETCRPPKVRKKNSK